MTEHKLETRTGLIAQAQHYKRIVLHWKWSAMIFFVVVVGAAALYVFLADPIFTAGGSIWIEDEPKILPFEEIQSLGPGDNLPSQTRLLQSRALAVETIEKLKLYEKPQFAGTQTDGTASFAAADPVFRERLIEGFLKSITVTQVGGTRLVDVRFTNRDPKIAADTLNALFDGFIAMIIRKRYTDSEQATEFLNAQITALRNEIDDREIKLNTYGSEKNILPPTATEAPTITRLAEFNRALTAATIERINRFNYYNQIKSAPLGEIPETAAGTLIQTLRAQYSALNREYTKRLATIRPEYPEMQRLKSELDAATEALQNETQNLVRMAFIDYEASLKKEQSFQKQLDDLKTDAFKSNSNSIQYNNLRIELASKKTLLEALTRRQSETDVSSQLKSLKAINVWVVDKADPPLKPTFPNKRKILLFSILLGLAGGIGLPLGFESLNRTVRTSTGVAAATGLTTLGAVPSFKNGRKSKGTQTEFKRLVKIFKPGYLPQDETSKSGPAKEEASDYQKPSILRPEPAEDESRKNMIELIVLRKPMSIQAESYRSIKTTLLISSTPGKIKSILVTSPLAGEGKSTIVSNLAITLAKSNLKIVIVDSDLRKPKQNMIFSAAISGPGLSRYLSSSLEMTDLAKPTRIPNLFLIESGPLPSNPLELLASEKMGNLVVSLRLKFDFILFDTPPILAVSDALAICHLADGIIIVARGGQTPIPALKQANRKLDSLKLKPLGVILNGVNMIEQDGYYARQYEYYSRPD